MTAISWNIIDDIKTKQLQWYVFKEWKRGDYQKKL